MPTFPDVTAPFATLVRHNPSSQPRRQQVARTIHLLNRRQRLVLALYYVEDLTTQEIGAVLSIPDLEVLRLHDHALRNLGVLSAH